MGNPKSGNNILPNKLLCINIPDIRQRLSLNPLCEVIYSDKKPPSVSHSSGKWPYNIQAPLCKWPRTRQRIQYAPRLMNVWSKPLALITLFNIILCFFLHTRSPVALSKSPICLLYDFYRFLHVVPPKVAPPPRDGHKVSTVLKKSAYIISVPQTARNVELFFVFSLPLHFQEVTFLLSRIKL